MNYWRIRELRKAAKVTQDRLAEELGVNRATISKYETGLISPTVDQVKRISDILGVSLAELLGIEPDNDSDTDRKLLVRLLEEYAAEHGGVDAAQLEKIIYFDEHGLRFRDGSCFDQLVTLFDSLNPEGQRKAVERVEELTEIPKYQKEKPPQD